jgi:hypothetical protein
MRQYKSPAMVQILARVTMTFAVQEPVNAPKGSGKSSL